MQQVQHMLLQHCIVKNMSCDEHAPCRQQHLDWFAAMVDSIAKLSASSIILFDCGVQTLKCCQLVTSGDGAASSSNGTECDVLNAHVQVCVQEGEAPSADVAGSAGLSDIL